MSRLNPKPSTVKKLFAYSGNACAMPDCPNQMVDKTGTMLGKIAHIYAANPGGARYNPAMTDEERRAIENLIVVCGRHHDVIDDPNNVEGFPAEMLVRHKKEHEDRFKRAERQFLKDFSDRTQASLPKYPKNMRRLYKVLGYGDADEYPDEIPGIAAFIDKLKELPIEQRSFAIKLAERMRRNDQAELDAEETESAFEMSRDEFKRHMGILDHRGLGDIEESMRYGRYDVRLFERNPGGNPWVEILEFCDATDTPVGDFIFELNFVLYDD